MIGGKKRRLRGNLKNGEIFFLGFKGMLTPLLELCLFGFDCILLMIIIHEKDCFCKINFSK